MTPDYEYSVITKENQTEFEFDPRFWEAHPDWNFFIRTNKRWPDKPLVWIGGGGISLPEAIKNAEISLRACIGSFMSGLTGLTNDIVVDTPCSLVGKESATPIKNAKT